MGDESVADLSLHLLLLSLMHVPEGQKDTIRQGA